VEKYYATLQMSTFTFYLKSIFTGRYFFTFT